MGSLHNSINVANFIDRFMMVKSTLQFGINPSGHEVFSFLYVAFVDLLIFCQGFSYLYSWGTFVLFFFIVILLSDFDFEVMLVPENELVSTLSPSRSERVYVRLILHLTEMFNRIQL